MPRYKSSHVVPNTFEQVCLVLAKVNDDEWAHFQTAAKKALSDGGLDAKIKPSSLKKIATSQPHELIRMIADEHREHHDIRSEGHLGGGLHHGIASIAKLVWNLLGGNSISKLFRKSKPKRALSKEQVNAARMISGSYQSDRPESVGDWKRLPEFDSSYGSIWENNGKFFIAVRGTKPKFKDIFRDGKILIGNETQRDDKLDASIKRFVEEHPDAHFSAGGHSLGTELLMNYLNDSQGFDNVDDVYLFNPASSFTQSKDHIKENVSNPKVDLFLNTNDPVSAYYSQNLGASQNVWWAPFLYNPAAAHSLNQWTGGDTQNDEPDQIPEKSEKAAPKIVAI